MRLHSFLGRFSLPVALIGLATIGLTLPAQADPADERPLVDVFVPDEIVTIEGKSKTVEFAVVNGGATTAEGLIASFGSDDRPIPSSLEVTPPQGCTDLRSCELGDIAPGDVKTFTFKVERDAGLPELSGAEFPIFVGDRTAQWYVSTDVSVLRVKAGVDLEVGAVDPIKLAPGKSATVPVAVRNTGNRPVDRVTVVLAGEDFLSFPATYSNCVPIEGLAGTACFFDEPLGPDEALTVSGATPLRVKAAADAPGPADYFAAVFATHVDADLGIAVRAAKRVADAPKSRQLELVDPRRAAADDDAELNGWDNVAAFEVKVSRNPADTVAVGATFAGAVGETRTVEVGLRNDGPAATFGPFQGWIAGAMVTIPAGVGLTKVDENCFAMSEEEPAGDEPGQVHGREYVCLTPENVKRGEEVLFSFTGRITGASPAGSVVVDGGEQDPEKSNDTAAIAVKLTAGGSGGGLPVTGAPAGLLAGGGALLLAAGAVAFVTARRRRIVTVVE